MNKVELLAPAKNLETAIEAINCGADAVYIGAPSFGARINASNSIEDIKKLVKYAHKFYVRVHVTINTILNNNELEAARKLIFKLYEIGVDAIIIQDLGILQLASEGLLPPIALHMSTQCDNRTLEKVQFFDKIGASRIILARELSVNQIKNICSNVNCEVETFVHGALCVSYSGQCYLSFANGGRSANRGECAQPCRKKYSLITKDEEFIEKDKYLLSLKDFNASKHLKELVDCGVKSFKIEGRLKDINYVKSVVLYYNNLLSDIAAKISSGKVFTEFKPDINKSFNRGYTDYFLKERGECFNFLSPKSIGEKIGKVEKLHGNYFETKAKLNNQDGICFFKDGKIYGFLINKTENNKIYPNKIENLYVGATLYRNNDFQYEKQISSSKIQRKIGVSIKIENSRIYAQDENNNLVYIDMPKGEPPANPEKIREKYIKQFSKLGESDFYLTNIDLKQDIIDFLPIAQINNLRRTLLEKLMDERLRNYPKSEQKTIEYKDFPLKNIDYRGNVLNNKSKEFYKNCNCDVTEFALESQNNIRSGIELMRTKHCLRYACNLCLKNKNISKEDLFLLDENGKKYPLKFDCKNCEMVILSL